MNLWKRAALALCLLVAATSAFAQSRVATITLGRDPEPPFCVMNPGGNVQIFWDIQHTTTPNFVRYTLQDPTRTITLESQTYPGNTGLNIVRNWIVPNGLADGKYWVRVEYWSFQSGNEANAEVTFYVCSESGSLCAYKYEDANCNGELDPSDPPVADWWICFTTPENDVICRQTDANGQVCLNNIPTGDYHVEEPAIPGWIPIGPNSYDVTVTGGGSPSVTFLNVRENYCTGACCFHDGHCEVLTENDCVAQGGTYQGNNSPCDPNPCPQPTGACCFHDGHCESLLQADCEAQGGIWQGIDVPCDPNPCPQPFGACCFQDGHCEYLTEADCGTAGGMWLGIDVPCDPNPCDQPLGACCYPDGHCAVTNEADCAASGGIWQGMNVPCDPNPCVQPLGACCFPDGTCKYITEAQCEIESGIWLGFGTVCDPNPCPQPVGACCFADGGCLVLTEADCLSGGGTWYGMGTVCDPNSCPQPPGDGACCLITGECVILTQSDCLAQNGSYYGDDSTCDPNPCPPPVATRPSTWGRIKNQYR